MEGLQNMDFAETQSREEMNEKMFATESLLNISENSSATQIRTLELIEYCKHAKINLKVLKTKIQSLSAAKNDAIRTRNEMLIRQKINSINLKSLFQTRNAFYNYKCDIKTEYVEREVKLKKKRLEYNLFTTKFNGKWESFERECKKIPLASEMYVIQKENISLYAESIELRSLLKKNGKDYFREISTYQNTLIDKIVEFVKEYQKYFDFLNVNQNIRNTTIQLEKLQRLQESLNRNPKHKAAALKKSILKMNIQSNLHGCNLSKDPFSVQLKELDNMLIPLGSLSLEVLDTPIEEDSFIYSTEMVVNLDTSCHSDLEKDFAYEESTSYKSDYESESNAICETRNRNHTVQQNEIIDSTSLETQNPEGQNNHSNDIVIGPNSVSDNALCEVPLGSSPPGEVSQYWKPTQDEDVIEGTEIAIGEVEQNKNCTPKMLDNREMADERNPKRKKYSTGDFDPAVPMLSSGNRENTKPTSRKCEPAKSVQGIITEEQPQNNEIAVFKEKVVDKEPAISAGLWNKYQGESECDEGNDKNGEINFSFFLTGGDTDKTKNTTGSSIFNLF